MCPRLHVDNVPLRLLVTYTGAGTLYAENAAVDRTKLLVPPEALGNDGAIRPGHELKQTSVGDVLLLKGNTWPGNEGDPQQIYLDTQMPCARLSHLCSPKPSLSLRACLLGLLALLLACARLRSHSQIAP